MSRKSKIRDRGNPTQQPGDVVASFRRLIHAPGNLFSGLRRNRISLPIGSIEEVVQALMPNPIYRNLLAPDAFPRSYARVKAGTILHPVNAGFELIWAASILSHYKQELNEFLALKASYSASYLASNYLSAESTLAQIEESFGISLWLTNARLSLAHMAGGIASQKDILSTIVSAPGIDALYAYVSFYFSYSLEESVTLNELRREFTEPSNIRDYAMYHVSPFDLDSINNPEDCISVESNSPIVDRFETLIDMMLLFYLRKQHLKEVERAVILLRGIADMRLSSLEFHLSIDDINPSPDAKFLDACDRYSLGDHEGAAQAISSILKENQAAAWIYELAARNDRALGRAREPSTMADTIILEIRAFLDLSTDLSETRGTLVKLGLQTRKLLPSRAVTALLDRVLDVSITDKVSSGQGLFCLSSPLVQPSNYGLLRQISAETFSTLSSRLGELRSPAHKIALIALSELADAEQQMHAMSVPSKRANLYLAYHSYNQSEFADAAKFFNNYRLIDPNSTSPRTLTFQYALYRRQHLLNSALGAFVDAYFENPRSHSLYSMGEFASWAISRAAVDADAVDRSILLHVHSLFYGSDYDGDLSDSLEDILDNFSVRIPSELIYSPLAKRRLIYVLRFVSNIDRLEDTTRFDSLDEVEAERIAILQWLVQNDSSNRTAYTQEISSITKDQEVARLSAQFERSKIYVHEEGIRRTFESEIKPQFFRYRQLLADPVVGVQVDQIEQRIRKLLKESDLQFGYLLVPSTERDAVYFAMIQRAYDIFGLDPNHGFKTYLSTRILHGILEGELRTSFVNEGLLVSVDGTEKEKDVLEKWKDRLVRFTTKDRSEIAKSVVKFSERVSGAISDLKDRRIRILSKENPEGMFAVAMSEPAFERLKQSVTGTTTYEEFFDRLFLSFWESIEACLREVKLELAGKFNRQITSSFDGLESNLTSYDLSLRPTEILDALARCRTSFGINLERVTAWFARAGVLAREPFLASTAIRVAARITNNCFPRYPLDVHTTEVVAYEIAGDVLNPLVDLLTNCFQNAAEHSGVNNRAPSVAVNVELDDSKDLVFSVRAELSDSVDLNALRKEMKELVDEGDVSNPSAVSGEGRTGIRKMKRILRHDFQSGKALHVEIMPDRDVVVSFSVPRSSVRERTYH
jgi:hypothetical protein